MKVGIALPQYDFSYPDGRAADLDATVGWAKQVEDLGFDSVWLSDHFFLDITRYGGPPGRAGALEPLTSLAAIAIETSRVRLGTLVLCYAFRHPALLAKMAATLDGVSQGRLELGLGAGWYEDEFRAYGYDFPPVGERMDRLREVVEIVGGMLASPRFAFSGRFWRVVDAPNDPRPIQTPRPQVFVGSKGRRRSLKVIADVADGWNTVWRWTPEAYAARAAELDRLCEEAGRDPRTVRRSLGLYALVGNDIERRYRDLQRWAPGGLLDDTPLAEYAEGALVGTPDECAERLRQFEALGVEHVVLSLAPVPFAIADPEQLDIIAADLLPLVR